MAESTELTYYTILTNQGIQYEQECLNSSSEFHITHIAVGDGNGSETIPTKTQTALVHEIARYHISKEEVSIEKGLYYAIAEIPYSAGNFTIREIGGYNSSGKLVAVANFPPTNKQVQEEWDIHKIYIRMDLCRVNERTFPSVVNNDMAFVSAENFENSMLNKANTTLNNLTLEGDARLHALKSYEDAGEVLTDAEGLADVTKYAHSNFDSSKFTTVGTLTITDGVASGFTSQTNYLTSTFTSTTPTTSIELWGKIIANNNDTNGCVICSLATSSNLRIQRTNATTIGVRGFGSGGILCDVTNLSISNGDEVIAHATVTATNVTLEVWVNGVKATPNTVSHTVSPFVAYAGIYTGGQYSNGNYSPASAIDLKYERVLFDGVEVFNGCKTGIDTYTIGGSSVSISYALAKDGVTKIAGSSSRTNIGNLYAQQGYAPYFTLDEVTGNFTLPQGNIYGLFAPRHKWVYADQTNALSTATAIDTYDLTSVITSALPNDGNTYECIFRYEIARYGNNANTADTQYEIFVNSNIVLEDSLDDRHATSSGDAVVHGGQFTAIIDGTRNLSLQIKSNPLGASKLYLVAYKQV